MLSNRTLTSKLTLLYSLSTVFILIVFSLFVFPMVLHYVHQIVPEGSAIANNLSTRDITIYCFKTLVIALLLGASVACLISIQICRRGLQSITTLISQVNRVEKNSLSIRINDHNFPAEIKALSDKFNLMLSRLEKSFDQMNQFSSDIAHELRNPLNTLMGETELALCGKADAEKLREILVSNMEEYRHLNRLISSLLFISKTERGILNMHKQAIVACEEINAVCELYISKLSQAGISLNIAQNSKEVYVDPTLFKQVINNLLTNAINYTPSGGLITIDIDDGPEGYIRIQIQDNGIGIETTHLSRLCDRFYRVDISRSKDTGGMGLGLAICKSIVELHQGSLSIESQVNQGTTVKLLFPTSA